MRNPLRTLKSHFGDVYADHPLPSSEEHEAMRALAEEQQEQAWVEELVLDFQQAVDEGADVVSLLVTEEAQPTALLQHILNAGQAGVNCLFQCEQWQEVAKNELSKILNAVPDAMREAIPNRHALQASVSRQGRVER